MQYRSDIKKVKGLGTAKHGFGHWWMQRLSGALMVPLGLWFIISLMRLDSLSPDVVMQWLYNPVPAILMALWSITIVYHGALGLQVIIEDYVHNKSVALLMLTLVKFAMFFMILVSFFSLSKLIS